MLTAFVNGVIFTGKEEIAGKALLTENGLISGIVSPADVPAGATRKDCQGLFIAPGLIDLQIAGAGGYLFSSSPLPEALEKITNGIIASGTTAFLISIPTNDHDVYLQAFRAIKEYRHSAVLGLHMEGPFISIAKRGAHIREMVRKPSMADLREILEKADGAVKMMTLAPEVCDTAMLAALKENGIVIAAGHSNATFAEATEGFNNGVETVTHLFNAMSPIHHRDPGLPGAVFLSDNVRASIIADGIHVNYSMLTISKKIMKERLFLVSDAVEENSRGAYKHIRQDDRFVLHDGTLSGARLTMLEAVRNCVIHAGIPLDEALRMASSYPADLMKDKSRGYLEKGYRADLIVFSSNFEIRDVFVAGDPVSLP